jgi:hypothetical protein
MVEERAVADLHLDSICPNSCGEDNARREYGDEQ